MKSRTALRRSPSYLPTLWEDKADRPEPGPLPPEVLDLLEQARRNERQPARKHHIVPASYLSRWETGGKIRVTETTSRATYTPAASQAARETDFYRVEAPGLDKTQVPPLLFETLLGLIEGKASPAITHLVNHGATTLSADDRKWLSVYLAFQLVRGRSFRAEQEASANMMFKLMHPANEATAEHLIARAGQSVTPEAVASTLEALLAVQSGELTIREHPAAVVGRVGELAKFLEPHLFWRRWRVYWSAYVPFVTSDEPVVVLEGPDADRRRRGGVGTADVVVFPLSPEAVLAMFHPDDVPYPLALWPELDAIETAELNREVAANSHRWLFERSDRTATLTMPLPPLPPANAQDGPLMVIGEPHTKLFNQHKPSRWWAAPCPPPLPVQRWYRLQDPTSTLVDQLLPDW